MTSSLDITEWTVEYFVANRGACNLILKDAEALKRIPLINEAPLHDFKNGQIIRFIGMIQDMHNPEYFFQEYEVQNKQTGTTEMRNGMYKDCARCLPHEEILYDSEKNQTSERQTYVVISIPGLNKWARKKYENPPKIIANSTNNPNERNLNENNVEDMDCSEPVNKKLRTTLDENNSEMDTAEEDTTETIESKEEILNFPIPMDDGKACVVKIYEEITLKLNQIIDIIGFISFDDMNVGPETEDIMNDPEMDIYDPPADLIPRLHAIKISNVAKHEVHNGPEIISKAEFIRKDLHLVLSQLLFGDELAADYLICHLLSSIYMRRAFFCLGTFPLNITNFPAAKYKQFPKDFYNFLTLLVDKSHFLGITLENLNDLSLLPKKDYECNRLKSGVLQLSENTHLVLDETGLTSGEVSAAGQDNYYGICNLINFQRVMYDFHFYKIEHETDIQVLIFSEAKSFIPCPIQLVLKRDPASEDIYPHVQEIANQYLKDETRLRNIRDYLEFFKHAKLQFKEDVLQTIQKDFVQIRQANKNFTLDHLHLLMVLARLISLSHGSEVLTIDYWTRAVQMELERLSRLPRQK